VYYIIIQMYVHINNIDYIQFAWVLDVITLRKNLVWYCISNGIFFFDAVVRFYIYSHSSLEMGTVVAQWLRRCATNRKVAGSIPDGVIGVFH